MEGQLPKSALFGKAPISQQEKVEQPKHTCHGPGMDLAGKKDLEVNPTRLASRSIHRLLSCPLSNAN